MRILTLLLLVAGMAGCASDVRTDKFGLTVRAYERALRWSDFGTALAMTTNVEGVDFMHLKSIRVTSYDVLAAPRANNDVSKITQVVEIRYVNTANMSERVLADQQTWIYSEKDARWKLESPFPSFR